MKSRLLLILLLLGTEALVFMGVPGLDGVGSVLRPGPEKIVQYDTLERTLVAYYAGLGAVSEYRKVPPYNETRNIRKVRDVYRHIRTRED